MSDSDTSIEKIEILPGDNFPRSEFASVVFHTVSETYPADAHIECSYTITEDIVPTQRDWVGIYKVGWMSSRNYIYYEWAPLPNGYQNGVVTEATILFQAHTLPDDDGEFYQFCYVSSAGQIRGASTPFQFKKPRAGDYVEVVDEDTDMLIIRSRTLVLEENLKKSEDENKELIQVRKAMVKEVLGLVDRITELQKELDVSNQDGKDVQNQLAANQKKLDDMLSEANDMLLARDELHSNIQQKDQVNVSLEKKIAHVQGQVATLETIHKALLSEKDELEGRNKTIQSELDLYKAQVSMTESSTNIYVKEIEMLNSHLIASSKTTVDLKRKIEDYEEASIKCHEEICQLKSELHLAKTSIDKQVHVTNSEKENVSTLTEKLHNTEDKLATQESTKELMLQELQSCIIAQEKMSQDLAASMSECHMLKNQVGRMEEDFSQENALLQSENQAIDRDMKKVLLEKENLQARLSSRENEVSKLQNSADEVGGPMYALKVANKGLRERLGQITDRNIKLLELKKQMRLRERELVREVSDFKERIEMCSNEYKQVYTENRKLHKKLGKLTDLTKLPATPPDSPAATQTTEMAPSADDGKMAAEVLKLKAELTVQISKKIKYKKMYLEQSERVNTLRRHYHQDLQKKYTPIRTKEDYIPKPTKRTIVSKKPGKSDFQTVPLKPEQFTLKYGNPFLEESKILSEGRTSEPTPMEDTIFYPPDLDSPPRTQEMSRNEEPEDVFVDASPHLPKPLEPEVTAEAHRAAVMAVVPQSGDPDYLDGACCGMPVSRTGILTSKSDDQDNGDGDDIIVKIDGNTWLINSNGEKRRCPTCMDEFPAQMKEEDFLEHVVSHMGRICPVCKMQVDDTVTAVDFEYHVDRCVNDSNNN